MTDSGAPDSKNARQNGAAVLIGILVAGLVAGVFILTQSAPSAPETAPAAVQPTRSGSATSAASASPSPVLSAAAVGGAGSETYAECVAYMESIGYDPADCVDVDALYKSASADPARDPDLPINQPPAGCTRDVLDEPGVFACSGASESPPKDEPNAQATCRADRATLGMDPDLCGHPDSKVSIEARSSPVPTESTGPVMRRPGFRVTSEFSSPDDAHPVGLQWPGGELVITLDSMNARLGMSLAGAADTRYYSLSATAHEQRSNVAAGNYIIWVEPSDRQAPLSPYSLTVSRPQ
ncbi:MAG: hypothetical protein ABIM89_17670 [Mycobacteriales bacterium]